MTSLSQERLRGRLFFFTIRLQIEDPGSTGQLFFHFLDKLEMRWVSLIRGRKMKHIKTMV